MVMKGSLRASKGSGCDRGSLGPSGAVERCRKVVSISSTKIELIFTRIYIAGFLRARRISVFTRFSRAHFRLWWAPPIVRFLGLQGGGHGGLRNIDLEFLVKARRI